MENTYDTFRKAMGEARQVNAAADSIANDMAEALEGRLRKVSTWKLRRLKRELSQFNSHTRKWKEQN